MPTNLLKPVTRALASRSRIKGRQLIVTLEPGDIFTFREKGLKRSYSIYAGHCYNLAQIMTADEEYKKAVDKYKEQQKTGGKKRKPKKPFLPFSRVYYDALK